jgi:hypothetical protein
VSRSAGTRAGGVVATAAGLPACLPLLPAIAAASADPALPGVPPLAGCCRSCSPRACACCRRPRAPLRCATSSACSGMRRTRRRKGTIERRRRWQHPQVGSEGGLPAAQPACAASLTAPAALRPGPARCHHLVPWLPQAWRCRPREAACMQRPAAPPARS